MHVDASTTASVFIAPAIASVLPTNLHGFAGTNIYAGDQFECADDDPGYGDHLMLSFFAYGDTDVEVDENLSRVFKNITRSCVLISQKMASALRHPSSAP